MRYLFALVCALRATAQQAPFTLEQVLGASFPSDLITAPAGGKVAWVSNARGVRNVMVAEPPRYQGRTITPYRADDGQEIQQLRWTPDGSAVVYVRGGTANPASSPFGVAEEVWIAALDGSAPRKLGEGNTPDVSPRGDRVVYLRGGQVWWSALDGKTPAGPAFQARGTAGSPRWSPDGSRIVFTSARGDHGLIGVFDTSSRTLRYLDPSTDFDSYPEWSADGRNVAFIRTPSNGMRPVREARRQGEPWSIRVASVESGAGREVWRANEGPGSVLREVTARNQVLWAEGRLVFPWEADGWTHLYAVPEGGGKAVLLTPGSFEVEDVSLTRNGREVIYSSNQGDVDRRHLWRVPVAGGSPTALTTGQGIECKPAATSEGGVAFLRSDAKHPLRPAVSDGSGTHDMDAASVPQDFPLDRMIAPQPVTFHSADGLPIHGQLFLPPNRQGARSPAVVFFHGGSRRQMLLGWHPMYYYSNAYALNQYLANSGYVVLSVNFRSGIGYGLNFREALNYGPSGASEYNDVQGAGVYLRSRADVDGSKIGVWGGSYGGYLVALGLARASDLFQAGVDFHGVHNWATELNIPAGAPDYQLAFQSSPMAFVKEWRSPVLLIHGDDDRDVQFNQTVMLKDALRRQKVDVEELIFPDEIHDFLLHRNWVKAYGAAAAFLNRKLR